MTQEEIYNAEQEYKEYLRLMETVEILTQAEYEFCKSWEPVTVEYNLFNLGGGRWLNNNVYSEAEHHDHIFRMECGL
jgi:hypothetical protein